MLKSILDNDLYKFTMQNAVCKLYPRAEVQYMFTDRNNIYYPRGFAKELQELVKAMVDLQLSSDEQKFMAGHCHYLKPDYLDFLQGYRYDPDELHIQEKNGRLDIAISGPWYRTILWEVPLLAMISELYFELSKEQPDSNNTIYEKTKAKEQRDLIVLEHLFPTLAQGVVSPIRITQLVVDCLKASGGSSFLGTSNVHLAHINNLKPIEEPWPMNGSCSMVAIFGYLSANRMAF